MACDLARIYPFFINFSTVILKISIISTDSNAFVLSNSYCLPKLCVCKQLDNFDMLISKLSNCSQTPITINLTQTHLKNHLLKYMKSNNLPSMFLNASVDGVNRPLRNGYRIHFNIITKAK